MINYLTTRKFNSFQDEMTLATKSEVMRLLDAEEISLSIKDTMAYITEDECNVKGSKKVIDIFTEIKNKKSDMLIPVEDIVLQGFDDKNLILSFKDKESEEIVFTATGIYSFTNDFLDQLFSLDKFASYCFKNNEKDLISETIEYLLENTSNKIKQYRFIDGSGVHKDKLFLRAVTSKSYKNYDNNEVLYLALNAMHRYSKKTANKVYIENAIITDSSLDMTMKVENRIPIGKDYSVEIGVNVSNSEIKEGAVLFEFIYTIFDKNGNSSTAIGDSVVKIQHNNVSKTVKERLAHLNELDKHSENVLEGINATKLAKKLNEDELYVIFEKFSKSKTLSAGAKTKLSNLQRDEIVNNTLTIIELFGKLEQLETTIDDRIFIQKKLGEFLHKGF